ncbi:hypothetical protein EMIHUDRAFT_313390 [Emiliania huxleyi CCMP1516]|uniref:Uncharacterized protein n=2 Tax=Emiliania huxleyi TaxID=2903 RepID=A0A0D3KLM1_EMIH1|nr:hypothetical protein EMIHUDRAFT_313390 [Emiliania huxleyi CCMP1516]EOD36656.1 hypothetical protein EMIHUDRAFT_313390 [Emiliania huxleyi CCMP1516]|eukprot:XP_005789085.1 hypothetical protein EMIHUDRAFT_313390 [Emiliania huxleyi CCMP1516]
MAEIAPDGAGCDAAAVAGNTPAAGSGAAASSVEDGSEPGASGAAGLPSTPAACLGWVAGAGAANAGAAPASLELCPGSEGRASPGSVRWRFDASACRVGPACLA